MSTSTNLSVLTLKGCTNKLSLLFWIILLFVGTNEVKAQVSIKWDKAYGGNNNDVLQYQQQTSDGGYILGGTSNSSASGDKSNNSKGEEDFWVIKVDASGNKQWDKTFGGTKKDFLQSLQQTTDGGYILGGYSNSPVSWDKSVAASANFDYWIIKINSQGKKVWDKSFGGAYDDFLVSIQQTSDKGFILGGTSGSLASGRFGMNKTSGSKGEKDYWIVKIDATGRKEWDRTIGGKSFDFLRCVKQTYDNGYILGGYSYSPSSGHKTGANRGFADYWIVKLNAKGLIVWNKTIGGSNEDVLQSLEIVKGGGFILGGTSSSPASGNKSQASRGETDFWIVKINDNGAIIWDKTIGGKSKDNLRSVKQTSDGGYILGGYSTSPVSGDKTESSNKDSDYWLVKINSSGSITWDKTVGGSKEDGLQSVQQISSWQYVLAGYSQSPATEDRTAASKGNYDFWLVRLNAADASNSSSGMYSLTATASGEGSIVKSSSSTLFIINSVVSLTAKPKPGYRFVGWSGDADGTQNPLILTMSRNKTIGAKFARVETGIYEAEAGGVYGGVRTNEHGGYSGKGYVDIVKEDDAFVQWIIPGLEAANYELTFRYANYSGRDRPLKVLLNGNIIEQSVSFKTTKSWTSWSYVTVKTVLKAGVNVIRLKSFGKGGPNVDYLRLTTSTNAAKTMAAASSLAEEQLSSTQVQSMEQVATATTTVSPEIKAYPNPFNATINLAFDFVHEEEYELTILHLDGTIVKSFPPALAKANETVHLIWEAEAEKSGIYLAKLRTKNGVQTLRIIKN